MPDWGPFGLNGKRAVVTGGAMGIGFGIARRFVEAGANVLIADLDETAAQHAVRQLAAAGGKAAAVRADVTEDGAGAAIVARCLQEFGGIDVFVNNAGVYPFAPALEATPEFYDRVYRINLRGTILCAQAAARQMAEQGSGGKIINIASVDGIHPLPGLSAYDASKAGVIMYTKTLALEVARHNVQVNAIAPGATKTEGTQRLADERAAQRGTQDPMFDFIESRIPARRRAEPDDIAKVAVFLASSASDYVTGTVVVADGGMLLT